MKKKSKKKQKSKEDPDLEKEWKILKDKIKNSLKKSKTDKEKEIKEKKVEEDSDLEKELEEIENKEEIQELDQFFQNSMEFQDIPAPVLKRIESRENLSTSSQSSQSSLEQNIASQEIQTQSQANTEQTENTISYSPNENYLESNKKYLTDNVRILPFRENQEMEIQELINPLEWNDNRNRASWNRNKRETNIQFVEENRKLPFVTKEDKKYKEVKL